VIVLGFAAVRLAPGDPVMLLAGDQASQEYISEVRERYGLDQPMYIQFARYSAGLAQGDLGYSYANKQSVVALILERLPATLLLVFAALLIALVFGLALALIAVRFLNTAIDRLISALSMVGYSVPVFWLAQLLIYFFAVKLDLFPASGMTNLRAPAEGFEHVLDVLYHLVLPAANLGLIYVGLISRLARAEMAEILTMDFITTARAKGLTENQILVRHVLRNALAPVVTMSGVIIGMAFAGAIFTETIFGWPGLGRLLYDALFARDYPVVTGMFLFISVALVLTNIVVDFIYSIIDPRVQER
jgi:peptide/nickel transport system permease protein